MSQIPTRPFTEEDIPAAAALCAAAFDIDPGFSWVAPTGDKKKPFLNRLFRENLAMDLERGARGVSAVNGEQLAGVMLWFPPGAPKPTTADWVRRLPRLTPLLAHPLSCWRGLSLQRAIETAFPQKEKNLAYFKLLAVSPKYHGQGVGSALLDLAIQDTARNGLSLYLETATEKNAAFYAKRGFTDIGRIEGRGRPTLWKMRRTPS